MREQLLDVWDDSIRTIADLGCRDCWHTTALPGVTKHVGVEAWPKALQRGIVKAEAGHLPNFEPILSDVREWMAARYDNEYDAVLAIDLLEHLPRTDALGLLYNMARVARKLAVVWTTLGFIEQAGYDVDGNENPFEEHLWGPTPEIFQNIGWEVRTWPDWHEARGGAMLGWLYKG